MAVTGGIAFGAICRSAKCTRRPNLKAARKKMLWRCTHHDDYLIGLENIHVKANVPIYQLSLARIRLIFWSLLHVISKKVISMKVVLHVVSVSIEMSTKTYNSKFYTPNAISTAY